jgi:hypothetical protein
MNSRGLARAAALLLLAGLSACSAPPPAARLSAEDACRALIDSLNSAIPPGQSLAELQARGIRVRTPFSFAPGTVPASGQPGGAAVQGMISPDGSVVPGSPKAIKSVGEAQLASAIEAGTLSMSFEFDAGAKPAAPIPFTATYALCTRS